MSPALAVAIFYAMWFVVLIGMGLGMWLMFVSLCYVTAHRKELKEETND